jgi:ATP-binding cassette, subfamily B, bacterial
MLKFGLPVSPLRMTQGVVALVRRFWPYTLGGRTYALYSGIVASLIPLVSALLLWLAKLIVDEVFVNGKFELLALFAAAYFAITFARVALSYALDRLEASVVARVVQNIRVDLYRRMISLSPGSFGGRSPGDLLTHLTRDTDRVEYLIYTGQLAIFSDGVAALCFIGFLFLLSWKLTICALFAAPLLFLVSARLAPRVRRASLIARRLDSNWMSVVEERLGAVPLLHAFASHERETNYFLACNDRSRRAELRAVKLQAAMSFWIEIIAALGGLAVLAVGAVEIRSGTMTTGTLVAFFGSVGSLYAPVRGLANVAGRLQRAAAAGQRVAGILDTPSLVAERPLARELRQPKGKLEFVNVRFAYPDGDDVLRGVSLAIEPGETVAVVGASGSGKSTLVRLALRLYDPSDGAVLIDGVDLRDVKLSSLARTVAPVFQEPYILRGSIADNIRYGWPEVPQVRMRAVAQACHVEEFATAARGNFATEVGSRGTLLSGGQRQRIALARALLGETPILLLDEATASVDSETEELMQGAIARYAGRRTMLIVAHRLSSVLRADRVVVLHDGSIVESGPPSVLLAGTGRCRDLFAPQLAHVRDVA